MNKTQFRFILQFPNYHLSNNRLGFKTCDADDTSPLGLWLEVEAEGHVEVEALGVAAPTQGGAQGSQYAAVEEITGLKAPQ